MLLQAVAVINDRPQSLTISWAQMDDNASAHPADSHGAARNLNPDSFVSINPLGWATPFQVDSQEQPVKVVFRSLEALARFEVNAAGTNTN